MIYDPPEGWRYGFPKHYAPLEGESIEDTLKRDGYPQRLIDQGMANHCRFLGTDEELAKFKAVRVDGQ